MKIEVIDNIHDTGRITCKHCGYFKKFIIIKKNKRFLTYCTHCKMLISSFYTTSRQVSDKYTLTKVDKDTYHLDYKPTPTELFK